MSDTLSVSVSQPYPSGPGGGASASPSLWVCIGTGPSLTTDQVDRCRGHQVIAVNDAYGLAPWANILYATDGKWWRVHIDAVRATFRGELYTTDKNAAKAHELRYIEGRHAPGLGQGVIHYGSNSGYAAVNLAYILGAKRIVLLGYDLGYEHKSHFFGDHCPALQEATPFGRFIEWFKSIDAERYDIVNATPGSRLNHFPMMTLGEALDAETIS